MFLGVQGLFWGEVVGFFLFGFWFCFLFYFYFSQFPASPLSSRRSVLSFGIESLTEFNVAHQIHWE